MYVLYMQTTLWLAVNVWKCVVLCSTAHWKITLLQQRYQDVIIPQASNFRQAKSSVSNIQICILFCYLISILQWHQLSVILLSLFILFFFLLINLWKPTIYFANKDQVINNYTLELAFFFQGFFHKRSDRTIYTVLQSTHFTGYPS